MNPKGGKLGTCDLEGIKESPAKPPEVDLEFNTPRILAFNAKSSKIPSLPKKAKQPTKWIFLFLSKNPREALTLIHHL